MINIEAVVFDIGNVLFKWQPERYYDAKFGQARRMEMFAATGILAVNDDIDRGRPFQKTIYDLAEKFPEYATEIRLWHDDWIKFVTPEISWSVRLLRQLKAKKVPVFALSNFGKESFVIAERHFPVLGEFDRRYISGHMKTIKPEARIYEMLEQDSGVAPEALLFVDDKAENISAASARGWKTHLFENPEGWAKSLVRHGVLENDEAGL